MYDTSNENIRSKFVFCCDGYCQIATYKNNLIEAVKEHNRGKKGKNVSQIENFLYDTATDEVLDRFARIAQENGYELYAAHRI